MENGPQDDVYNVAAIKIEEFGKQFKPAALAVPAWPLSPIIKYNSDSSATDDSRSKKKSLPRSVSFAENIEEKVFNTNSSPARRKNSYCNF